MADVPAGSELHAVAVAVAAVVAAAVGLSVRAIASAGAGAALVLVFMWVAAPGVLIARRLFGGSPGAWAAALLIGPAWCFAVTSVVLLALWAGGVRNAAVLVVAPALA